MPLTKTSLIENISVEVLINRRKIKFYSCYLPASYRTADINQHFANDINALTRINTSFFALGDFNATHRSWNCSRNNKAGNILSDNANNGQFFILNTDTHTHFPSNSNHLPSTLDLILTNGHFPVSDPFTVPLGSDHAGVSQPPYA